VGQLTDETLMAYADGELDAVQRAEVETALAADPRLRERVNRFAATGKSLAKLFEKPFNEPVPPHIVGMIMHDQRLPQPRAGGVSVLGGFVNTVKALFPTPAGSAIFAWSVALLLGGAGAVWYVTQTTDAIEELVTLDQGEIFARGPLKHALETAPSGSLVALGSGKSALSMTAVLTFKNQQQAFCRQYGVTTPKGDYAGVACRQTDGEWRIEVHTTAAPQSHSGDRVVPAGKAASSVEDAVTKVIEGDALGSEDEQTLILKQWRP
jgi:hypothetical protein